MTIQSTAVTTFITRSNNQSSVDITSWFVFNHERIIRVSATYPSCCVYQQPYATRWK